MRIILAEGIKTLALVKLLHATEAMSLSKRSGNRVEASLSGFPKATMLTIRVTTATSRAAIVATKLSLISSFKHSFSSFD